MFASGKSLSQDSEKQKTFYYLPMGQINRKLRSRKMIREESFKFFFDLAGRRRI